MSLFRLENNVPDVYVDQSRDFQLLLRLYDSIFSGLKFDIDSINYLIDTPKSRNSILQLLGTKLGFFTNLEINDDKLRIILTGFPDIVKNKGSLLAIKQTLNLYLKTEHIKCSIIIYETKTTTIIGGQKVLDHTISIGSDKTLKNIDILYEIFKYIFPIGFGIRFYTFRTIETETIELENNDDVVILFKISTDPMSQLRSSFTQYSSDTSPAQHIPSVSPAYDAQRITETKNELIGSVGIIELAGSTDITQTETEEN